MRRSGRKISPETQVESELRSAPRDALLDAISALEPLLVPQGKEELRFRFAIHYASLAPLADSAQRHARFLEARRLYDARSSVAHGGDLPANVVDLAASARTALRETILALRNNAPASTKPEAWSQYWTKRLFGLE